VTESIWILLLKVLGAPLIAAGIASFIAYKLAYRRFMTERWWERKADAYSNILSCLSEMQFTLERWIDELETGRRISEDYMKDLNKTYFKAKAAVVSAASTGAYIISEDSAKLLSILKKESEKESDDFYGDISDDLHAVENCIKNLRECAKKDLGVK